MRNSHSHCFRAQVVLSTFIDLEKFLTLPFFPLRPSHLLDGRTTKSSRFSLTTFLVTVLFSSPVDPSFLLQGICQLAYSLEWPAWFPLSDTGPTFLALPRRHIEPKASFYGKYFLLRSISGKYNLRIYWCLPGRLYQAHKILSVTTLVPYRYCCSRPLRAFSCFRPRPAPFYSGQLAACRWASTLLTIFFPLPCGALVSVRIQHGYYRYIFFIHLCLSIVSLWKYSRLFCRNRSWTSCLNLWAD